jgi:ankyrin repeat protein
VAPPSAASGRGTGLESRQGRSSDAWLVEVTRALLEAGADLNRSNSTGCTPLPRANNHEEAVLAWLRRVPQSDVCVLRLHT